MGVASGEHDQAFRGFAGRTISDGTRSINRELQLWRAVHNWGIRKSRTNSTPFKIRHADGAVSAVNLFKERPRRRRLDGDEEARLLDACGRGDETKGGTDLQALVECALDTCCRKGELLSLQWSQVDVERNEIFLPAEKTKSGKLRDDGSGDRWIPMTQRVRSRLRLDAEDKDRKPTDYVFGNAAGEQIKSIKTAWKLACRRAGIVGLHFHDLRREGASSLLESRMSEHDVKDILGHANIRTTSTYLATTRRRLQEGMKRAEAIRRASEKDAREDAHEAAGSTAAPKNAEIS